MACTGHWCKSYWVGNLHRFGNLVVVDCLEDLHRVWVRRVWFRGRIALLYRRCHGGSHCRFGSPIVVTRTCHWCTCGHCHNRCLWCTYLRCKRRLYRRLSDKCVHLYRLCWGCTSRCCLRWCGYRYRLRRIDRCWSSDANRCYRHCLCVRRSCRLCSV